MTRHKVTRLHLQERTTNLKGKTIGKFQPSPKNADPSCNLLSTRETSSTCLADHVSSALMAEALAVRSALLHAIDLNFNSIWLQSNSQVFVAALSSGRHPTELYRVLSDIATISCSSFCFCRFTFIKREFNGLADSYAK
ncbi:hypothetical protein BRARA_I02824, partial [Brassica rapa]